MFGTPGEDLFISWFNFALIIGIVLIGFFLLKIAYSFISFYISNRMKNKLSSTLDKLNNNRLFKVVWTIVYIIVCLIIIGYSSM
jgi:ABC-type tungstate transport system substrate-binding protein